MKLNEPKQNEIDKWPKTCKKEGCVNPRAFSGNYCTWHKVHGKTATKSGIILEHKDYIDYLKDSEYKESYKKFCIDYYLNHKSMEETYYRETGPK